VNIRSDADGHGLKFMAFIRRALSRIGVDRDNHLQSMEEGLSHILIDHEAEATIPNHDPQEIRPTTPSDSSEGAQLEHHTPTKVRTVEALSPLAIRVSA
jgi:hypothetical protein